MLGRSGVVVDGFELGAETTVAPTLVESSLRVRCRNAGPAVDDAVVFVDTVAPGVLLVDPVAHCGRLAAGASGLSADPIVLRRDPSRPFEPALLEWFAFAFGPSTLVASDPLAGGGRRLRYEIELTSGATEQRSLVAVVTSRTASAEVTDALVAGRTQPGQSVRNEDVLELELAPGAALDPLLLDWTLSVGSSSPFALAATRTLDGDGQPLGDVGIEVVGAGGGATQWSEADSGIVTLTGQGGTLRWRFSKDGHLPVWREAALATGTVQLVPSPWLAARSATAWPISVLNGGTAEDGGVRVVFPPGALPATTTATLTSLGPQTLPALLPAGWSPLAAFWLELGVEPREPAPVELGLAARLAGGERAVLARLDPTTLRWVDTGEPVAVEGDRATARVAAAGAYAVVVADRAPTTPPAPAPGQPLEPTPVPFPLADGLGAEGSVTPPVAAASEDAASLVARAAVRVSHAGPLPSGLVLRTDVDERYRLRDGRTETTPGYETSFVAHQRPGDDDPLTLHADLPLRPCLALGPEALDEARVTLAVVPVTAFQGGFFGPNGGRVGASGVLVTAPPGAVAAPQAVELRPLDPARFAGLATPGEALQAFELVAPELAAGTRLALGFGPQAPDAHFVLARLVESGGRSGLEPRERFASDAYGVLRSAEPATGPSLPGVTGSGVYVLVRTDGPRALVQGVARDAQGAPVAGLAVTIDGEPWLTFSAPDGRWRLVAPPGERTAVVTDLRNGDRGTQAVLLADAASVAEADVAAAPAGPRVVEVDPADGATGVRVSTPIRVAFSERVAPLAPGDLVLTDADGSPVAATLSTNLARTEATLLPVDPLATGARYTLTLAGTIADPGGLPLEGPRDFAFTTRSAAARGAGAQLVSWEPGAQTSECDDVPGFDPAVPTISCVVGSPGSADPDVPVVLVNETRGTTATVRSRLDGSFENFLEADVDDFLAATFVNANGTRIRIPLSRQLFDDGSVALFEGGGILEAESDGGPVQILIEPGTIRSKNKFQVDPVGTAELLAFLQGHLPVDAQLLDGAMRVTVEGEAPDGPADLSFPVDPATLALPPGVPPEQGAFAAAVVRDQPDGSKVYEVVDKLRYEDGRISSNTFPFLGLMFLGAAMDGGDIFSMMVVPIFLGADPVTVTGRVLECPGGECLGLDALAALQVGRPLPGAFVSLRSPSTENSLAGRLDPGMVYATSGPDGRYALVAPTLGAGYVLTGMHPKHARPVTEPVFGVSDFSIVGAVEKNLVFSAPLPGSINGPVRVNAAHTPLYPASGQPATLQVNAYHGAGAPAVAVALERVEPLAAGVDVSDDDVQVGPNAEELLSPTRKRVTVEVSASPEKALLAVLRIRASASSIDPSASIAPKEILHSIAFGVGPPPPVANGVIPADANDEIGPMVVTTIPSDGAVAFSPGDEIVLFFNEPIDKAVEDDPSAIAIAGSGGAVSATVELSADQRALVVRPGPLSADTEYTLTASTAIRDVSDNDLDQEPGEPGAQGFTLQFRTARSVVTALPGVESGGGAVLGRGAFAYVLDRASAGPSLVVFDVSDPTLPDEVTRVRLPGAPRDLAFIPRYAHQLRSDAAPATHDLVAVVGGDLGSSSIDDEGNVFTPPQYLRVFDVENPASPQLVVSTVLTQRIATVTKVEWRPPFLVYLESGADAQFVSSVLLQEAILAHHLTRAELDDLPLFGVREIDANGDGDFVDDGDRLPTPNPSAEFFGKRESCIVDDANQRILDFDFERGFCAVTLTAGKLRAVGGGLGADVPPQYRTLTSEGQPLDRAQASFSFGAAARPKRLDVLFNVPLEIGGAVEARNLALVSLSPDADGTPKLAVIDVSLPASPQLLVSIPFAEELGLGQLQSVSERSDGLLALATTTSLVLLDPALLGLPAPASSSELHPAVVGVVREAGSGAQSNDGNAAGVNVVSLGSRNQLVLSSPRLSIVQFGSGGAAPGAPPVVPSDLVDAPEEIELEFERMAPVRSLAPARLREAGGATPTLDPPSRLAHYHVLADLPGGAGGEVKIALESLNRSGRPLSNLGRNFPPVRAAAEGTLADLDQETRDGCDAEIREFKAYRLSSDPKSPYYNKYLSIPFALTYERVGASELDALRDTPEREILWSGHFLRASIDPDESGDAVLGPFTSLVDAQEKVIRPGTSAVVRALPAVYVLGPNPPPPGGGVEARGSLGMLNAGNGEVRHETLDLALPGKRMPIVFQRAIGGQDLHEGPFGRGWDLSYAQKIVPLDGDVFPAGQVMPIVERATDEDSERARSRDVVLETGNATVVVFRHAGTSPPPELASDPLLGDKGWLDRASDFYLPQRGVFDALLRFPDGHFLRVTPDGTQFWYAAGGRLERIYHRYESSQHVLAFNDRDELVRVTDLSVDEDRFVEVGYWRFASDPIFEAGLDEETGSAFVAGKIARLRDSVGRDVLFFYNEDGQLERREGFDLEGANGGFSGRPATTYISSDTCAGDFEGIVAGAGGEGAALFDASLEEVGVQPAATDASGAVGSLSFSPPGENRADAAAGARSTITVAGTTTAYTFDALGNPSAIEISGPNGEPRTYGPTYDDQGRLVRMVHPEENEVEYVYDSGNPNLRSRGNLLAVKRIGGPRGGGEITESYSYDARYNQPSGVGTDGAGNSIIYTLDASGRDVEGIDYGGEGRRTFQRNADGQVEEATSPDGVVASTTYDATTGYKVSTSLGDQTTGYGYDASIGARLGLPTTIQPASGESTHVSYDARGLPTEIVRGGLTERRGYDENGNPTTIVRTTGSGTVVETRAYDQLGFLLSSSYAGTEPDFAVIYDPDAARRPARVTYPGGVEELTWDHQGNLVRRKVGTLVTDYVRDRNGNVVEMYEGGTLVQEFVLDGHDRVVELRQHTGSGGPNVVTYAYDGNGVVSSVEVTDGVYGVVSQSVVEDIDALGRIRSMRRVGTAASGSYTHDYVAGDGLTVTSAGPAETVTRHSDAAGRLRTVTDSVGTVTHARDANGNVDLTTSTEDGASFLLDYAYDPLDHLVAIEDGVGLVQSLAPRADGRVETRTDGRGNATQETWTALGELLTHDRPNGVGMRFGYDASRLLGSAQDAAGNGETYTVEPTLPFRLQRTTRSGGGAFEVSARDARGNPTSITMPGGSISVGYDLLGRPISRSITFGGGDFATTSEWDAIGRLREATYPGGTATYDYDKLGPLVTATFSEGGQSFSVGHGIRADGARTSLEYPSNVSVSEGRDPAGRLTSVGGAGVSLVVHERGGRGLIRRATLGGGIQETREHDARRRLLSARYEGPAGLLADVRYRWDGADNPEARQEIHRGARADLYAHDAGNRLGAAHVDARPASGTEEPRALASPPLGFAPGLFARSYGYDGGGSDLLTDVVTDDPDGLPAPLFAASRGAHDGLLHANTVDGFARARDALGNTTRTQLVVRDACPGPAPCAPVLVPATLTYDGASQLVRVERDDGVTVEYDYQHTGLFHRRRVIRGGTLESERAYVWDEGRLLEEWEILGGQRLVGRYYYRDEDAPFAAALAGPGGLETFYFLRDAAHSVMVVADAAGAARERVHYDPFGQPTLEAADSVPPRIARVVATADGARIEFSEPISAPFAGGAGTGLVAAAQSVASAVEIRQGATPVPAQATLEEAAPGFPFGTVVRVRYLHQAGAALTMRLAGGSLVDGWNNPVAADTIGFTDLATADAVLFAASPTPQTGSDLLRRSAIGSPMLFQGQWFDYETGLLFLRARFYDAYSGQFLQRDPAGYETGPNPYAAFANNPTSFRDPSGAIFKKFMEVVTDLVVTGLQKITPRVDLLSDDALRIVFDATLQLDVRKAAAESAARFDRVVAGQSREAGEVARVLTETMEDAGRHYADDVIDSVLGDGARTFDEQFDALRDTARRRGLTSVPVTDEEFKAAARVAGSKKTLSGANPARTLSLAGETDLFVRQSLVDAARAGATAPGYRNTPTDARAVLVANYGHEVGDHLLEAAAGGLRTLYPDNMYLQPHMLGHLQTSFERAFVERLAEFDRSFAEPVAAVLREPLP